MRTATRAFLATLALWFGPTHGVETDDPEKQFDVETTEHLLKACTWDENDSFHGRALTYCIGYITAAYHYDYALNKGRKTGDRITCPPEDSATLKQAMGVFVTWARAHPEFQNELAVEGVMRSANAQWPCRK